MAENGQALVEMENIMAENGQALVEVMSEGETDLARIEAEGQSSPEEVKARRGGYKLFMAFAVMFAVVYIAIGVVIGSKTGTGTGFGDTRNLDVSIASHTSFLGDAGRIAFSLGVLVMLPAGWYWFLHRLGDFGHAAERRTPISERGLLTQARVGQAAFPGAHRLGEIFSVMGLSVLLVFGWALLPYVVVRWGWGMS